MAPGLKVYATSIGFHDVAVAAPNQKAALEAWDVRENLFAGAAATATEDKDAVDTAEAALSALDAEERRAIAEIDRERKTPESRDNGLRRLARERDRTRRVYENGGA